MTLTDKLEEITDLLSVAICMCEELTIDEIKESIKKLSFSEFDEVELKAARLMLTDLALWRMSPEDHGKWEIELKDFLAQEIESMWGSDDFDEFIRCDDRIDGV